MPSSYSQLRAAFALAKASLIATLRSPTSVVFSLLFPLIFIVVFGSMVDNTIVQLKIVIAPGSDTASTVYKAISSIDNITIDTVMNIRDAQDVLQKGRITAIVDIRKTASNSPVHGYELNITSSASSADQAALLRTQLKHVIAAINEKVFPANPSVAIINENELPGRAYRRIDFILPGQLGFSLLMAGVFGSSFLLFNLRQSLVLKRLSATPVNRAHIIMGEMLSRLFFHIITFIIIVVLGHFAFNFTLVNGFYTFMEMLFFSLFGVVIFMGIGFIISGVIQNESSIAPVANTVTLPQILLCGLFFPVENYPHWLQAFCNILPLTFFVDGLRKIAFEGGHFWQMPLQVFGLITWGVIISLAGIRLFKWE